MSEKLIPVRSESELRAGMLVVRRRCGKCGRDHREMLLPWRGDAWVCADCKDPIRWEISPAAHAGTFRNGLPVLPVICYCNPITERRLFRVDTGLDDEADRKAGRLDADPQVWAARRVTERVR